MIYDPNSPKDTLDDVAAFKQEARELLRVRMKQFIFATFAFLAGCGSVAPFLAGFRLHRYWESVGKQLLMLTLGLLIIFASYIGMAMSAWFFVREVEKMEA